MASILPCGQRGLILPGGPQTLDPRNFAVPDGLVGYWGFDADCFDPVSGVAFDLSGNNLAAIKTGASLPTFANGVVGGAANISVSLSGGFKTPSFKIAGAVGFSVSQWVYLFGGGKVGSQIFSSTRPGAYGSGFSLAQGEESYFSFFVDSVIVKSPIIYLKWVHLGGVYDKSNVILYVNGVPVSTPLTTAYSNGNVQLGIGSYSSGTYYANALIDETLSYPRPLAPWEITQLYQAGLAGRRDAGQFMPARNEMPMLGNSFNPAWALQSNQLLSGGFAR